MRRSQLLQILVLLAATGGLIGSAGARPGERCGEARRFVPMISRWDLPAPPADRVPADTVWFGGYDEAEGIAYNS
ncbi:MAG: hypothetical protein KAY32_18310, partial [Candidatus Eisenbacteria sp.]|nr:hypothetical protein [Candidatus Eisenbacteria bacterium]